MFPPYRNARYHFLLLSCLIGSIHPCFSDENPETAKQLSSLAYTIRLDTIHRGYDGKTCWVHPRAGILQAKEPQKSPSVILTMQKLLLTRSDVFYGLHDMRTDDLGKTWTTPTPQSGLDRRRESNDDEVIATCDFTPQWHAKTGKLLGIGQTVRYRNDHHQAGQRSTTWSAYDPLTRQWSDWQTLTMPDEKKFHSAGAGSVQRYDLPNGDILLPIYFKGADEKTYRTTVLRCRFDGKNLSYLEHGSELTIDIGRGLYEPSLTFFQNRYYLTMRNDEQGYVSVSNDGLNYSDPISWCWDDGSVLGNYNTQQHWVTHSDAIYLVYTRRGANNDHVFRHRAPLFIAQVNPQTLQVIRSTERILVPERGARLGNFGVTRINDHETWVTVAEWMQKGGRNPVIHPDNPHGADNSVYVARIQWQNPIK